MIEAFDLNWRHLRTIVAIAARGSMSGAADAVGISQPALTQGIAKIERQVGASLFDRGHDGVTPTAAGAALAERAAAALDHLATACRDAARRGARGFARPEQLLTATQLRAFLHVADTGSFLAAAARAGLAQPTLHRAVRDFEQVVALHLVERRGRGIALTAAGRRVARGVRLAHGEIEAALAELAGPSGRGGRIVVGAMPLSRAALLPAAIAAFVGSRPDISIRVVEGSWRELVEPLRDGVIDLMIGALRDDPPPGLEQRALFDDRLAVIGRADHPLADEPAPTPTQLAAYPWLIGPEGTPVRGHWRTLFENERLPAAPVECGSVMVARGVMKGSDVLTLLSPDQVALEIDSGVLARIGPPLSGAVRTIGLTTRTAWRPTTAQAAFIDELVRIADRNSAN